MKKRLIGILTLLCAVLLAGCGGSSPSSPASSPDTTQSTGHYPVTIQNYDGYIESNKGAVVEETYDKAPERILVYSQPVTEILIGLGLQDKIVATGHAQSPVYEPYADIISKIPTYEVNPDGNYPIKEVMLSYDPDIIVGWGSSFQDGSLGSVNEWHDRGIHTYIFNNTVPGLGDRKVSWIIDDIEKLGQIFDVEDRADEMIADIQARLDADKAATADIPDADRPGVLTLQFMYENEFTGRSLTDLTADIINLAGGTSLDEGGGSKQSIEVLIDKNPDIILVVNQLTNPADKTIEMIKQNPQLQNLEAVKNNRFMVVEHAAFYCGSMRTIDAIDELSATITQIMNQG